MALVRVVQLDQIQTHAVKVCKVEASDFVLSAA